MIFYFPAHVTNSIGDRPRVNLRKYHKIIFPVRFNFIDDALDKFLVFIKGFLSGFLKQQSSVDQIQSLPVVLNYFVEVLRSFSLFNYKRQANFWNEAFWTSWGRLVAERIPLTVMVGKLIV
jgi:hypothetical protein